MFHVSVKTCSIDLLGRHIPGHKRNNDGHWSTAFQPLDRKSKISSLGRFLLYILTRRY